MTKFEVCYRLNSRHLLIVRGFKRVSFSKDIIVLTFFPSRDATHTITLQFAIQLLILTYDTITYTTYLN